MTSRHDEGPSIRRVTYSKTFRERFGDFIAQGERLYGARLAEEKEQLVLDLIDTALARNPAIKRRHSKLGLVVFAVSRTPFILIFDYDDQELRVLTCLLKGAGERIEDFDPAAVEW